MPAPLCLWIMEIMTRRTHRQRGFTLIELVMVTVIIGILMSMALPRLSLTNTNVHSQAAQIARDIRHVQMLAMTQGSTLSFVATSSGYTCQQSGVTITDPATQQAFSYSLRNSVQILTPPSVRFDTLGRPVNTAGTALLATAVNFTVSGGDQSSAISISPVTGFVTVSP